MYDDIVELVRDLYPGRSQIYLHEPILGGSEKSLVVESIDSGFVSSAGAFVNRFEQNFARAIGVEFAIATMNGTAAIHAALILAGVTAGDEVITQSLTFVATCNAIAYTQAHPIFVDVNTDNMGLSPEHCRTFLEKYAEVRGNHCINRTTNAVIRACLPMHTFGHPAQICELRALCEEWRILLIEDAAEAVGSLLNDTHLGTFGKIGTFSFNGNKIITTGGGGMIVTNDGDIARRAKHLTTTAKISDGWEFSHDMIGFNYRMPNINAAIGCAQLNQLDHFIERKRWIAAQYRELFSGRPEIFLDEPAGACSNFWLNAVTTPDRASRDALLQATNVADVTTRPIWKPMHKLPMYKDFQRGNLENTEFLYDRVVCLPSSVPN